MKKVLFALMFLVAAMGFSAPTPPPVPYINVGSLCDDGPNPGATLLIPYFEVNSADTDGMDTYVGFINLSPDPIIAHVSVWNVDSWVVFDFNIYVTGYDVVTFGMRDIIVNGNAPNNGCTSPTYMFTTRYIDCDGDGAYFTTHPMDGLFGSGGYAMDIACYPTFSAALLADWQCKLSIGSYDGWNANYVGYVTIDATISCNGGEPDGGVFQNYYTFNYLDTNADAVGDHGILEMSNILMGDMFYYDHKNSLADGMPAVSIQAFGETNALAGHTWGMQAVDFITTWGINTFYNKYEFGSIYETNDRRAILPVWWAFRYITNAAFDGGTWVDVWRSHNRSFDHWYATGGPCNWNGFPAPIYTTLYDYVDGHLGLHYPPIAVWDEEEHTAGGSGGPSPPPAVGGFTRLYLEAQRDQVAIANGWPLIADAGWIALDFATDDIDLGFGYGVSFDQSWLNVRYFANNKYSVGLSGTSYLNGCILLWDAVNAEFAPIPTH